MTLESILAAIKSNQHTSHNPITSQIQLSLAHSRGPAAEGRLTTMTARLKPDIIAATRTQPRVIFVIDKSGSMQGANFQAARAVFKTIFDSISEDTLISIVLFNNINQIITVDIDGAQVNKYTKSQVSTNIETILAQIQPDGSTNTIEALTATAQLIAQDRKPTQEEIDSTSIIFITDGQDNRINARGFTLPGHAEANTGITGQQLFADLLQELAKVYSDEHLPRIVPIGIGQGYSEQYLTAIGNSDSFHRTGFIHIAQASNVSTQSADLIQTVDPVRIKADLLVTFDNGSSTLLPWAFIQQNTDKSFICDSSQIEKIFLIQHINEETVNIVNIVDHIPAAASLNYDDAILKSFVVAENARIHTTLQAQTSNTPELIFNLRSSICQLLQSYPRSYWQKDAEVIKAIDNLEELYRKTNDLFSCRKPVIYISTRQTADLITGVDQDSQRDQLLVQASAFSRQTSAFCSPDPSALSACTMW